MPIEPDDRDLRGFRERDDGKPLVMVQLLRFAEGGRDRYLQYSREAQQILARLGAQVLYAGECTHPLVAGDGQAWDAVVLVRYPNRTAYLDMVADAAFVAIAELRRSALREAVLLPMDAWPGR
jgi:uncharacterized protein (DUF1330 family)